MSAMSTILQFQYTQKDLVAKLPQHSFDNIPSSNNHCITSLSFDTILQKQWLEAKRRGCFRYDLDNLETKILPGKYNFVAQLNVKRALQRRKPQAITDLHQPFDPNQFNFLKVMPDEILFEFKNSEMSKTARHLVIVNVSPLEFCNSLLVPNVDDCLPQSLDGTGLRLAIETVLLSVSPSFRIGFNSLCAYASINHYHFHMFYLNARLYIETAPVKRISGGCYELLDYAVPGFVFQLIGLDVGRLVQDVMKVVEKLKKNNVPYNLFITRGACFDIEAKEWDTVRVFVWPRLPCEDDKDKTAFNIACCEISGHLPIKNEAGFHEVTENEVVAELKKSCGQSYLEMRAKIFGV